MHWQSTQKPAGAVSVLRQPIGIGPAGELMTYKSIAMFLTSALTCALGPVSSAYSEVAVCSDRKHLTELLRERYSETWQAEGVMDDGRTPVELFVSPKGHWTAVATLTGQTICVVATGEFLRDIPKSMRWLDT